MAESFSHPEPVLARLHRIQRGALLAAAVALLPALLGAWLNPERFFAAYLVAYVFWLGVTLGGLVWLLVQYIAGGRWGVLIGPLLESSALLVGLMALLFLPLLLGLDRLYPWAQPETVAHDALLQHKQPYLNMPFFIARAVLYFVIWGGSIFLVARWRRAREAGDLALADRLRRFSGPALALYGLAVTFAAVDWLMSLEPHWFSTVFGVLLMAGQAVAGLAFVVIALAFLAEFEPLPAIAGRVLWMDLGNLMLSAVLFWAYIAFVQFLIIWAGNLPEENVWYLHRLDGGWQWVAEALVILHFALPFALLLSAQVKLNPRRLAAVALLLLLSQLLHLFWLVIPVFAGGSVRVHWLDLVLPVLLGALWLAGFVWMLRRRPLTPVDDPVWQEAHAHG